MSELEGRLGNAIVGVIFALVLVAVFWIVAFIVRLITKKNMGSARYYQVAIIGGFVLSVTLPKVLLSTNVEGATPHRTVEPARAELTVEPPSPTDEFLTETPYGALEQSIGLDAPFIPPDESHIEVFPLQLESAANKLPQQEHTEFSAAMSFLMYSAIASTPPEKLEELAKDDRARMAMVLTRMYRYAQSEGDAMTLRKYIDLADTMKRDNPELWQAFQELKASKKAS